jgi:hypothetical protein
LLLVAIMTLQFLLSVLPLLAPVEQYLLRSPDPVAEQLEFEAGLTEQLIEAPAPFDEHALCSSGPDCTERKSRTLLSGPAPQGDSVEVRLLKDTKLIRAPFGCSAASPNRAAARTSF